MSQRGIIHTHACHSCCCHIHESIHLSLDLSLCVTHTHLKLITPSTISASAYVCVCVRVCVCVWWSRTSGYLGRSTRSLEYLFFRYRIEIVDIAGETRGRRFSPEDPFRSTRGDDNDDGINSGDKTDSGCLHWAGENTEDKTTHGCESRRSDSMRTEGAHFHDSDDCGSRLVLLLWGRRGTAAHQ